VGVSGVPLIVIGRHALSGVQDRETLEAVIEQQLTER
jgi:predicted DsbA family dithiol-disulfide isomerase